MYGALTSIAKSADDYKMQIIDAGCFDIAFEHINSSVSFAITEKAMELLSIVVSSEDRSNVTMHEDIFVGSRASNAFSDFKFARSRACLWCIAKFAFGNNPRYHRH
jgi:hypothetical protein